VENTFRYNCEQDNMIPFMEDKYKSVFTGCEMI